MRGECQISSEITKPSLYDRLGGVYSIAAVLDDFIDPVMHNPILNANPAVDEAHHRVSAAGFKYYVTHGCAGPRRSAEEYRPRNERIAQSLNITEGEWVAFCRYFNDTMAKFNVPVAQRNGSLQSWKAPRVISSKGDSDRLLRTLSRARLINGRRGTVAKARSRTSVACFPVGSERALPILDPRRTC